jgi:hypothetical protein
VVSVERGLWSQRRREACALSGGERLVLSVEERGVCSQRREACALSGERVAKTSKLLSPILANILSPSRASISSPRRANIVPPRRASISSPRRASILSQRRANISSPRRASILSPRRTSRQDERTFLRQEERAFRRREERSGAIAVPSERRKKGELGDVPKPPEAKTFSLPHCRTRFIRARANSFYFFCLFSLPFHFLASVVAAR